MVEMIVSLIVTGLSIGVYHWYEKKAPLNKQLTWGEAMIAGTYVFFIFFLIYGVVPHYWVEWADKGLGWRADVMFQGPHIPGISATITDIDGNVLDRLGVIASQQDGGWFPFRIPKLILRDIIAVAIHIVFLALNIWYWNHWQTRDARAAEAVKVTEAPSEFGRPLVRQGVR